MKNETVLNNFLCEGNFSHCSIFSGIGGFDLAAEWLGWDNVFQVEIDEWCRKVLAKNFPNTKRYADIKEFDGTEWENKITILSGGFPCQPFSTSGKQNGQNDSRYLFNEMLRAIKSIKPKWIVAENVFGITSPKFTETFQTICTSLENIGYEVQPFIVPATSLGANHNRCRVMFIAHSTSNGLQGWKLEQLWEEAQRGQIEILDCPGKLKRDFLSTPKSFRANDGLPGWMDRIRGLGNSVIPQFAFEFFSVIDFILTEEKKLLKTVTESSI